MIKKTFSKVYTYVFLALLLIVVGFALGHIYKTLQISFVENISVGNLLTLFTTLLVAYMVSGIFEKDHTITKAEKELLTLRVQSICIVIDSISNEIIGDKIQFNDAIAPIHNGSVTLNTVKELIKECKMCTKQNNIENIEKMFSEIDDLLTSTPPVKAEKLKGYNMPANIKGDIISMGNEKRVFIRTKLNSLMNELTKLQLYIIKS